MTQILQNINEIPTKSESQTLSDYLEILSNWYLDNQSSEYRKKRGQYFTPKIVADFMVKLFDGIPGHEELRILDPGAGLGTFETSLCEYAMSVTNNISMVFDLYEDSEDILPLLKLNMRACQESMAKKGLAISYRIIEKNFVLSNAGTFSKEVKSNNRSNSRKYDLVICNPPYYKLNNDSLETIAMKKIVHGQSNIYVLFMAAASNLIRDGGELIFITPRSYCSGKNFREFRDWFFEQIFPLRLHVFESRRLLTNDSVLQEMVVLQGAKIHEKPENIIISKSYKDPAQPNGLIAREVSYDRVVLRKNSEVLIRIPTSMAEELLAEEIDRFPFSLIELGFKAATGKVVPFRATEYLLENVSTDIQYAPLIWMENLHEGGVIWPLPVNRKPIALYISNESNHLCIPNMNYVLIKRFSTNEGKRRLSASVLLKRQFKRPSIAIENHVNYISKISGEMTEDEACGLAELFNSKPYNQYFQMANGSTQVNVSELNMIPLPSLEEVIKIGKYSRENKTDDSMTRQHFIVNTLGITPAT